MRMSLNSWPTVLRTVMVVAVASRVAECSLSAAAFQHLAVLDQRGDFVMRWTPGEGNIRVEIQVATDGWVGLGFSPSGGMRGADITLGWVDSHGEVHVHDRYAHGTITPVVDHSQDVEVEGGYQNDTHTVIRFSRPWNTCDTKQDFKLSGDTTRVIWAFGEEDPVDEMTMERHVQRGVKSIFLQEPGFTPPPLTENIETWDIRAPNVTLPSHTDTLYWCKLFKTPDFINNVHLIGFEPLISKDNVAVVHHIVLYGCSGSTSRLDKWTQHDGVQCFTSNMPPSWFSCHSTVLAWAVGSEGEMWPDNVGITLGESGHNYFVMEVHYDNPRLMEGIVDDSGLRLLYTRELRKNEAGVLTVGHEVSHRMVIPPGQTWRTVGRCGSPCLEAAFPAEGVKVIQVLQHAHLLGRGITLRHIRGDRELPIVLQDLNYDFNYQIARRLKKELTVLPGDSFILECQYDAKDREVPTFGGESTREEMCLAFLLYYPKVAMSHCKSHPTLENIYHPLGVKNIHTLNKNNQSHWLFNEEKERELAEAFLERKEKPAIKDIQFGTAYKKLVVHEPTSLSNKTLYEILYDKKTWSDKGKLKALQEQSEYGTHQLMCYTKDQRVSHSYEYPHFVTINTMDSECSEAYKSQVYQPALPEVKKQGSPSLAMQPTITFSLLLCLVALLLLFLK